MTVLCVHSGHKAPLLCNCHYHSLTGEGSRLGRSGEERRQEEWRREEYIREVRLIGAPLS